MGSLEFPLAIRELLIGTSIPLEYVPVSIKLLQEILFSNKNKYSIGLLENNSATFALA